MKEVRRCIIRVKLIMFFVGLSTLLFSQSIYNANKIPENLKEGVNAVIRNQEKIFTILSPGKAKVYEKIVITILNKKGDGFSRFYESYDNHSKINYIKGILYNSEGDIIEKLKKSEISDVSAISNGTLYGDNRVKIATLENNNYPYTVEFVCEKTEENLMFYPRWMPINYEKLSVEFSVFKVEVPPYMSFRHKSLNINEPAINTISEGYKSYKWSVSKLEAVKDEPNSPFWSEFVPTVYTAPTIFEVEGFKGDFTTWKSFGQFQNLLNKDRNDLPIATQDEIRELIANVPDKKEQVKKIYQYLQDNTRYVSIQLGIGGWQPFKASFVDEKKYGDCKALTNYTKSLLDVAGVKSYYTIVHAGEDPPKLFKDFPVSVFNHVFLCVPLEQDTVWLECTSQTNPFGYLGDFTGDRDVLLVKPEGGEIVHTPIYNKEDNLMTQNANVVLEEDGNAKANINIELTALQHDYAARYVNQPPNKQKDWLYEYIDIATFEIESYKFNYIKSEIPKLNIEVKVKIRKYASKSGNRLFLKPNLLSKWGKGPKKIEDRKTDLVLKTSYMDFDTITYQIPDGFHVEALPKEKVIESAFGRYKSNVELKDNTLIYTRSIEMNKGRYSSEKYNEYVDFRRKISKADKVKAVFVNKT